MSKYTRWIVAVPTFFAALAAEMAAIYWVLQGGAIPQPYRDFLLIGGLGTILLLILVIITLLVSVAVAILVSYAFLRLLGLSRDNTRKQHN